MSIVAINFYEGENGRSAAVPGDFQLYIYPPGSQQQQPVLSTTTFDAKLVAVVEAGIWTVHFSSEKKIVSLRAEEPGDVTMLVLEGEDARKNFDIYLWDIAPDGAVEPPAAIKATCAYCNDRYSTPGSPYYMNATWYNNCLTNPSCT